MNMAILDCGMVFSKPQMLLPYEAWRGPQLFHSVTVSLPAGRLLTYQLFSKFVGPYFFLTTLTVTEKVQKNSVLFDFRKPKVVV